jgi:hypothetical protein
MKKSKPISLSKTAKLSKYTSIRKSVTLNKASKLTNLIQNLIEPQNIYSFIKLDAYTVFIRKIKLLDKHNEIKKSLVVRLDEPVHLKNNTY